MPSAKRFVKPDVMGDILLAIGVGFLINFLLGVALPEVGPFIAGLVAGVMVKAGPFKGGLAGFLAGTLGGLASIPLWVGTNLLSLPASLLPITFQYAITILTAEYAILSLSGGIIGSVLATERWPLLMRLLKRTRLIPYPAFRAAPAELDKQED